MKRTQGVTIKDIARKAGVSTATVSRVINGDTKVSEKTRELVDSCLRETGYRVNPIARSLRSKRTHTIGILAPEFQNDFFMAVAEGIEEVLRTKGYTTFIVNSHEDPVEEDARVQLLIEKQVDGAIIIPAAHTGPYFTTLRDRGIPYVLVDRLIEGMDEDAVLTDNRKGAFSAVEACILAGARKVAFIGGDPALTPAKERFEGYCEAMSTHGLELDDRLIHQGDMHIRSGYDATRAILEQDPSIRFLFIINLFMRIGAEQYLAEHPEHGDLQIAAFDFSPISSLFDHAFATVRQPLEQIGTTAANLLLKRIEHADLPFPQVCRLTGELVMH